MNRVATEYAEGRAPSYGRIIGLSQRLDRSVRQKMAVSDVVKKQNDALKEIQKVGAPQKRATFQQSALSVVNG